MFRKMLDQLDAISDGEKLEDSSAADADDGQVKIHSTVMFASWFLNYGVSL